MNEDRVKELLRAVMRPSNTELKRDLWPELRERMDRQNAPVSAFDWALIAAVLVWSIVFPEGLLVLLYHL